MVALYNSVNAGLMTIGMRDSKEETRENMLPISDLETIFETIDRTIVEVAKLMAPINDPEVNCIIRLYE